MEPEVIRKFSIIFESWRAHSISRLEMFGAVANILEDCCRCCGQIEAPCTCSCFTRKAGAREDKEPR